MNKIIVSVLVSNFLMFMLGCSFVLADYYSIALYIVSALFSIVWLGVVLHIIDTLYKLVYRATRCKTYADRSACLKIF